MGGATPVGESLEFLVGDETDLSKSSLQRGAVPCVAEFFSKGGHGVENRRRWKGRRRTNDLCLMSGGWWLV